MNVLLITCPLSRCLINHSIKMDNKKINLNISINTNVHIKCKVIYISMYNNYLDETMRMYSFL